MFMPWFVLGCLPLLVGAKLDVANGMMSLYIYVPYTRDQSPATGLHFEEEGHATLGHSHAAAAFIAMEHFNDRNNAVVTNLPNFTSGCPFQFDTRISSNNNSSSSRTRVFDTGSITHQAAESFLAAASSSDGGSFIPPTAIAGPFYDLPATELSTLAGAAAHIPLVVHRAYNNRVTDVHYAPYTSTTFPGMHESAGLLADYLHHQQGRTNYLAMLHATTDTAVQRREELTKHWDQEGIRWTSAAYAPVHSNEREHHDDNNSNNSRHDDEHYQNNAAVDDDHEHENDNGHHRSVRARHDHSDDDKETTHNDENNSDSADSRTALAAMNLLKQSGFRTIVIVMEDPDHDVQIIAEAAEQLGMNNGDYFYIWYDVFEFETLRSPNPTIQKLLQGSALLAPISTELVDPDHDAFYQAWRRQTKSMVDRINAANPIAPGEPGYMVLDEHFFEEDHPEFGSAYMYDAVMSIGIGACLAKQQQEHLMGVESSSIMIDGAAHVKGIQSAQFTGATGLVAFGDDHGDRPGGRMPSTTTWAAFNLVSAQEGYLKITNVIRQDGVWEELDQFVYAGGRTSAPELRALPEQNYLLPGIRATGLGLMTITILLAVLSMVWVFVCRKHRVVAAAQPLLLQALCIGSIIQACSILTISFDESYGWDEDQLSRACMSMPWLISLGHIVVYSALFTKLHRVNKVLQFARRRIDIKHVVAPMILLVLGALLVLSLWTGLDPMEWHRAEVDEISGESIGHCDSHHLWVFITPLFLLMLVPTVLTAFLAFKTKDVDDLYAESWWVYILISVQVEVILVAAPLVAILRDVSTNGRYMGYVLMFCSFPLSTQLLIMAPKVAKYRRAVLGLKDEERAKRGQLIGTRVSGGAFTSPPASPQKSLSKCSTSNKPGGAYSLPKPEAAPPYACSLPKPEAAPTLTISETSEVNIPQHQMDVRQLRSDNASPAVIDDVVAKAVDRLVRQGHVTEDMLTESRLSI